MLLVLVYCVLSPFNKVIALFSAALLGVSNVMLTGAASVMSDMPSALMSNAPVLVYFVFISQWSRGIESNARRLGLISGLLFVAAVLTKESVVFFVPLFTYLAYGDRKSGKIRFWKNMFAIVTAGAIVICGLYAWKTGNPFYRLAAVNGGCSQSDCNYAHASWLQILKRISYQPLQFLVEDYGFGIMFFFSLLHIFRRSVSAEARFFKIYLVFVLGMWWIGPQGLPWNPVALVHRLWLPVMVPLVINAAFILYDAVNGLINPAERKRLLIIAAAGMLILAINLYWLHKAYARVNEPDYFLQTGIIYGLVFVLFASAFMMPRAVVSYYLPSPASLLFPVLVLTLTGVQGIEASAAVVTELMHLTPASSGINHGDDYKQEQEAVLFVESLHPACILTDYNLAKRYHIYDNFGPAYPFVAWCYADSNNIPASAYMLINKPRLEISRRNINETLIYTSTNGSDSNGIVPDYAYNPEHYGFVLIKAGNTHDVWQKR
jgi:hypothetical protein